MADSSFISPGVPPGASYNINLRLSAAQEKEKKKRYGAGTPLAAPLPYRFSHLFF